MTNQLRRSDPALVRSFFGDNLEAYDIYKYEVDRLDHHNGLCLESVNPLHIFPVEAWEQLGFLVGKKDRVDYITLIRCGLTDLKMIAFFKGAIKNSRVKTLDIDDNDFGFDGICTLVPFLRNSRRLKKLEVSGCNVGRDGFEMIMWAIHGKSVRDLSLWASELNDISALKTYMIPNLRALNLNSNTLDFDGVQLIAQLLERSNSKLEQLCLENNGIDDDGAEFLAVALLKNTTLLRLEMDRNSIGERGSSAFMHLVNDTRSIEGMLSSNHTLLEVDLTRESCGQEIEDTMCHDIMWNALLINSQYSGNSKAAGRAKVLAARVSFEKRMELTRIKGVENFQMPPLIDIDLKLLPYVLALTGRDLGHGDMYRLLVAKNSEVVSARNLEQKKRNAEIPVCDAEEKDAHISMLPRKNEQISILSSQACKKRMRMSNDSLFNTRAVWGQDSMPYSLAGNQGDSGGRSSISSASAKVSSSARNDPLFGWGENGISSILSDNRPSPSSASANAASSELKSLFDNVGWVQNKTSDRPAGNRGAIGDRPSALFASANVSSNALKDPFFDNFIGWRQNDMSCSLADNRGGIRDKPSTLSASAKATLGEAKDPFFDNSIGLGQSGMFSSVADNRGEIWDKPSTSSASGNAESGEAKDPWFGNIGSGHNGMMCSSLADNQVGIRDKQSASSAKATSSTAKDPIFDNFIGLGQSGMSYSLADNRVGIMDKLSASSAKATSSTAKDPIFDNFKGLGQSDMSHSIADNRGGIRDKPSASSAKATSSAVKDPIFGNFIGLGQSDMSLRLADNQGGIRDKPRTSSDSGNAKSGEAKDPWFDNIMPQTKFS